MDEADLDAIQRDYITLQLSESISDEERSLVATRVLLAQRSLIEEVVRLRGIVDEYERGQRVPSGS